MVQCYLSYILLIFIFGNCYSAKPTRLKRTKYLSKKHQTLLRKLIISVFSQSRGTGDMSWFLPPFLTWDIKKSQQRDGRASLSGKPSQGAKQCGGKGRRKVRGGRRMAPLWFRAASENTISIKTNVGTSYYVN